MVYYHLLGRTIYYSDLSLVYLNFDEKISDVEVFAVGLQLHDTPVALMDNGGIWHVFLVSYEKI